MVQLMYEKRYWVLMKRGHAYSPGIVEQMDSKSALLCHMGLKINEQHVEFGPLLKALDKSC